MRYIPAFVWRSQERYRKEMIFIMLVFSLYVGTLVVLVFWFMTLRLWVTGVIMQTLQRNGNLSRCHGRF